MYFHIFRLITLSTVQNAFDEASQAGPAKFLNAADQELNNLLNFYLKLL